MKNNHGYYQGLSNAAAEPPYATEPAPPGQPQPEPAPVAEAGMGGMWIYLLCLGIGFAAAKMIK